MKKFTLTLAACAVVFSGMAQMQKFVSPVPASMAEIMASKVHQGTKFQATAIPQSVGQHGFEKGTGSGFQGSESSR